jgi:hypothetical protein
VSSCVPDDWTPRRPVTDASLADNVSADITTDTCPADATTCRERFMRGLAFSSGGDLRALRVVRTNDGHYVLGNFTGRLDASADSPSIPSVAATRALLLALDRGGLYRWHRVLDASGTSARVTIGDVATDATGDLFVTGLYLGTPSFGALAPSPTGPFPAGFIACVTRDNALRWARALAPALGAPAVALAPSGEVVVAGSMQAAADLGSGVTVGAVNRGYVARYDPATGAHRASIAYPFQFGLSAVTVAPDGTVFVGGSGYGVPGASNNTAHLANPAQPLPAQYMSFSAPFVARLDANGSSVWAHAWPGAYQSGVIDLALTSEGHLAARFVFSNDRSASVAARLGGSDITIVGANPVHVLALYRTDDGSHHASWPTAFCDGALGGAEPAQNGDLVLVGAACGTSTFGAERFTGVTEATRYGVVARYSARGVVRWARQASRGPGSLSALALDVEGVTVAGSTQEGVAIDLGGGVWTPPNIRPSWFATRFIP